MSEHDDREVDEMVDAPQDNRPETELEHDDAEEREGSVEGGADQNAGADDEGVRLQKVLASAGIASRRNSEAMIAAQQLAGHQEGGEPVPGVPGDLRRVTELDLVTIARHHGQPVGFQVTLPDYGTGLDRGPLPLRLLHLVRVRHGDALARRLPGRLGRFGVGAPRRVLGAGRYISMYSGARPEHRGLGKALLMDFVATCLDRGADGLGALVAEGKVTGSYLPEFVVGSSEHCLYRRD